MSWAFVLRLWVVGREGGGETLTRMRRRHRTCHFSALRAACIPGCFVCRVCAATISKASAVTAQPAVSPMTYRPRLSLLPVSLLPGSTRRRCACHLLHLPWFGGKRFPCWLEWLLTSFLRPPSSAFEGCRDRAPYRGVGDVQTATPASPACCSLTEELPLGLQ